MTQLNSYWECTQFMLILRPFIQKALQLAEKKFMGRLKERWGITSNFQIILILIVFAINGSFAAWVASPVTAFFGLDKETTNGFIYWPLRILLVFPIYQLTLPIVGLVFGQFKFFWDFELKMFRAMGRVFRKKNA